MIPLSDEALRGLEQSYEHDSLVAVAVDEIRHHREHVTRLQARGTELTEQLRAAKGILPLKWKRIGDHALPIPARAHTGDAGLDLAIIVDGQTEPSGAWSRTLGPTPKLEVYDCSGAMPFRTGWAVEIPTGWFGLIVVRSSIGKAGWDLESSGVIDSTYRGEILLPMVYRGEQTFTISHGDRMAQLLLLPVPMVDSQEVDTLSDTARGSGSFGSSGQ